MNQSSARYDRLMQLLAYGVVVAVGVIALGLTRQAGRPWAAIVGLLLAYLLVMSRTPAPGAPVWQVHLFLGVQAALTAAAMLFGQLPTVFATLYFVASAQAMMLLPARLGLAWISAFAVVTAVILVATLGWQTGVLAVPMYAAGYFFFGAFALAVADANASHRKSQALAEELQAVNTRLHEYAARVEELAAMQERGRLAREMHDTLGHRLTVAAVQLEGAQRLIATEPERAAGMVATVRQQVREALAELRQTVTALGSPIEADLSLTRSLARLATTFEQATGLAVHHIVPDDLPEMPGTHRLALYRAAQEALTNVQRHACAGQVWLMVTVQDQAITLMVSDDGRGLSLSAGEPGFGLRGLRERAAQLGGELHVEPRRGGGTELSFRVPLELEGSPGGGLEAADGGDRSGPRPEDG